MRLTRRGVLVGGTVAVGGVAGAGALVEYEVLPGRTQAYRALGLNGDRGVVPDVEAGPIRRGSLGGADFAIFEPPDAQPGLPVVVALHGATSNIAKLETRLALGKFLASSGEQFTVAAINGGSSYWHPRADGSDTGALVLDAFLPMLADRGYDAVRPGFLGWSMGGYGAMLLATQRVERGLPVGPVAATSPAVHEGYTPAAFDSEADFDHYGMFARRDLLDGLALRIDCGRGDPFYRNVVAFREGLDAEVRIRPGAHDAAYWTRVLPDQLAWLGGRLSAAGPE